MSRENAAAIAAGSEPEQVNAPRPCVIPTEMLAKAQQGNIARDKEEKIRDGITNYDATKQLVCGALVNALSRAGGALRRSAELAGEYAAIATERRNNSSIRFAARNALSVASEFATAHMQCPQQLGIGYIRLSSGNISTVAPIRQSNAQTLLLAIQASAMYSLPQVISNRCWWHHVVRPVCLS